MLSDINGAAEPPKPAPAPSPASPPAPIAPASSRARMALDALGALAILWAIVHVGILTWGHVAPVVELPARVAALEAWRADTNPPGPAPAPAPPGPVAPTTGPFRAVFLFESSANLGRAQLDILNSTAVRAYLSEKCEKDADGRPAWRFWDKDVDASRETASWQKAMADAKAQSPPLPRVVITRGGKVVSAPLPATEAETLAYLKTFGG